MRTLLLVFLVLCGVLATTAQPAQGRRIPIDSCVNQFNPAKIESTSAGYRYWFVDQNFLDGRTLKLSVVAPRRATHPPHSHPEDELFFVLEGTAEFSLEGETRIVHPYASCYAPPNSKHGIRNPGDSVLKYLVIKKYPAGSPP